MFEKSKLIYKPKENLNDVYDFANPITEGFTYSGQKREVIDLLQTEIEAAKNDYLKGTECDYDPSLLLNPNFESYKYNRGQLIEWIIVIFEQLDLMSEINSDKLKPFLTEVSNNYQKVPYHNFTHAFTLVHFAYWMVKNIKVDEFLIKDDILSIVVACIIHDINHPGVNNAYLCKTGDDLAILYNDASVLENMHVSLFYQILKKNNGEFNIFDNFNRERYSYIREMIIQGVIDTDMSKHFVIMNILQGKVTHEASDKASRKFLVGLIIHACDLCNLLYEYDNYYKWCLRVTQEFSDQYLAEEKLDAEKFGIPTAMFKYIDHTSFYKTQLGFMNFVVTPMWDLLFKFFF